MNLKAKSALAGIAMLATLAMTPSAFALCTLAACAEASASTVGELGCDGPDTLCWSYSASGSHTLKPLSLYAGGIGHLEAMAANTEYVGRDVCIINIGGTGCGTHVGDNLWHGPAWAGCLQATATTKPNVGDPAVGTAIADCDAPRAANGSPASGGSGKYNIQLTWGAGSLLADGVRLAPLLK